MVDDRYDEGWDKGWDTGYDSGYRDAQAARKGSSVNERLDRLEESADINVETHLALSEVLIVLERWIELTDDRLDALENSAPVEDDGYTYYIDELTKGQFDLIRTTMAGYGVDIPAPVDE